MIIQTINSLFVDFENHSQMFVSCSTGDKIVQNSDIVTIEDKKCSILFFIEDKNQSNSPQSTSGAVKFNQFNLYNLVKLDGAHHVSASQVSTSENPHSRLVAAGSHFLMVFEYQHWTQSWPRHILLCKIRCHCYFEFFWLFLPSGCKTFVNTISLFRDIIWNVHWMCTPLMTFSQHLKNLLCNIFHFYYYRRCRIIPARWFCIWAICGQWYFNDCIHTYVLQYTLTFTNVYSQEVREINKNESHQMRNIITPVVKDKTIQFEV